MSHLSFAEPALATTFSHYRAVVLTRQAQLEAVEADLKLWALTCGFSGGP